MRPDEVAAPSLLPGWSRAHVVAHLVLNAEALARVLEGQRAGEPRTMYDDQQARDRDIEELSRADLSALRERLDSAVAAFGRARAAMTDEDAAAHFERTPGGQVIKVANIPVMRLREVEIHHADLGLDYSRTDWPDDFSALLVESMTRYVDGTFRVTAVDLGRTWQLGTGEGGPEVSGTAADLGWWLTGRGGDGLVADGGDLPRIGAW